MDAIPAEYGLRLDEAVGEVFGTMLGVTCTPVEVETCAVAEESYGAIVGFAGAMRGSCVLQVDRASGLLLAELLTGMEQSDEETIQDGLGELCNMIAGAWKGAIPELAADCMLSPPTVISGREFRLHRQQTPFSIRSRYRFASADLCVTVHCELAR